MYQLLISVVKNVPHTILWNSSTMLAVCLSVTLAATTSASIFKRRKTMKKGRMFHQMMRSFLKKSSSPEQKLLVGVLIVGATLILGIFVSWKLAALLFVIWLIAFMAGLSKGR